MSCVWLLQRGYSGDECDLASTLCTHALKKGDLFVLSWARVRRNKIIGYSRINLTYRCKHHLNLNIL